MIQVNQMVKNYGFKKVLNGVSFTAAKGEITCLIGINGAGKSTVLKSIMGLTPYKGEVLIDNASLIPSMYEKMTFIPDSLTMPSICELLIASALWLTFIGIGTLNVQRNCLSSSN